MSWQLAAFLILALALAGGFAWYERSRPDARVVALVATLAAFAALGRIAFAALPNVKPTTDIVLVSGYALGGAPGFAVGALAALASNFFFGQGPWTPWQMAAWGVTGLVGAALARPTRGRIGRLPLAAVCFLAGFAFTVTQDFGDWVNYSDHSLAQLGVYVGKGIGFDFVHAVGCLAFALALGPALTRSVRRFAARLEVSWQPAAPLIVLVLAAAVAPVHAGAAGAATTPAGYLLAAQNSDGGFGPAPGQPSSPDISGWVAMGLEADGYAPQSVSHDGHTLTAYLQAGGENDPGSLERTILALSGGGMPAGTETAALARQVRADGSVSDQVNLTAFAILALKAARAPVPGRTVAWLERQQDADGGFSYATRGGGSDIDDTGAALEALAAAGAARAAAAGAAVRYLSRHQDGDGGFPQQPGQGSNAQSTAWAVQGLLATGADLGSLPHGDPDAYLRSLISPDGHVSYARGNNQTPVWVTAEALMALDGKPLPLAAVGARRASGHATGAPGGTRGHRRALATREARHRRRRSGRAAGPGVTVWTPVAAAAIALALAPVDAG